MKQVAKQVLRFTFDPSRKGAKYTLDGVKYMNLGEFCEVSAKAVNGLDPVKDANTRFDKGADIPELGVNVKSATASLTEVKLSDTFEGFVKAFFERVAATEFWYVILQDDEVIIYKMTAETFKTFVTKFAKLKDGKVRLPGNNTAVCSWLEINARG